MKRTGVTNLAAESALIIQPSPHSFERVNACSPAWNDLSVTSNALSKCVIVTGLRYDQPSRWIGITQRNTGKPMIDMIKRLIR